MSRSLEHKIKTNEAELAELLAHIPSPDLAFFAIDVAKGKRLDEYCRGVTPDTVLRMLAYGQVLRELNRRDEVFALETERPPAINDNFPLTLWRPSNGIPDRRLRQCSPCPQSLRTALANRRPKSVARYRIRSILASSPAAGDSLSIKPRLSKRLAAALTAVMSSGLTSSPTKSVIGAHDLSPAALGAMS